MRRPGRWIALYAFVASTGFATVAISGQRTSMGLPAQTGTVVLWQALSYGAWLPVAAGAAAIFRRHYFTRQAWLMTAVLGALALPLHALLVVALDAQFAQAPAEGISLALARRLPIDMLIVTAIMVTTALLALYRQHRELADLLATARVQAIPPPAMEPETLVVSVGRSRVRVSADQIESITAAGNYVVVAWQVHEGLLRATLASVADRLGPAQFVRVHRSALANLTKVTHATPLADGSWRLTMASGAELVVSRTYRDAILARLGR